MISFLLLLSMLALFGLLLPLAGPWTAMQVGLTLLLGGLVLAGGLLSGVLGLVGAVLVALLVIGGLAAGGVVLALLAVPVLLLGGLGLALLAAAPVLLPLALVVGLVWLLVRASRRPAPPAMLRLPAPERAIAR